MTFDPVELAKRQIARDELRTKDTPWLNQRKQQRMRASPFAFLRGTAPLFYELLQHDAALATGPAGEGWIAGDLHLENFGAFRTEPIDSLGAKIKKNENQESDLLFDVNDFDEAVIAPWRIDILRLLTSVLLSVRAQQRHHEEIAFASKFLQTYCLAITHGPRTSDQPKVVKRLLERAKKNSAKKLIDDTTEWVDKTRKLKRSETRILIDNKDYESVEKAFSDYANSVCAENIELKERLSPVDIVFRVAGTGSLGAKRYIILTKGKGEDGGWLFDMKEQGDAACATYSKLAIGPVLTPPSLRVKTAIKACLTQEPRMLGECVMNGRSMIVRRLSAQEDKLAMSDIPKDEIGDFIEYAAQLVARVHTRGATGQKPRPWTSIEQAEIIERAVFLAGVHQAAHQSYCRLISRLEQHYSASAPKRSFTSFS